MRARLLSATLCLLLLLFLGCTQRQNPPQAAENPPEEMKRAVESMDFSFEGTRFYYGADVYDLSERQTAINAVVSAVPVGEKIVLSCHVGPKNGVYCIFDRQTQCFERDVTGTHFIWHSDRIETAVYAFWSEVYAYDGTLLRTYDLAEDEWIYSLVFSDDGKELYVTILRNDGTERTDTIGL